MCQADIQCNSVLLISALHYCSPLECVVEFKGSASAHFPGFILNSIDVYIGFFE